MNRWAWAMVAVLSIGSFSSLGGCAHTVLDKRTDLKGDGWTLTVRKVTDGPNHFNTGNVNYEPVAGERFIWAVVTLRNERQQASKFAFDQCDLDAGADVVAASKVDHDLAVGYDTDLDHQPEVAAGDSIDRRLMFVYPKDRSPTRLRCATMTLPLPPF